MASLVHMPDWVLHEINTLIFKFFWKGKRDLVARTVGCQPFLFRGFSVVSIKFKVWALHVEWARHLLTCLSWWANFLYFHFRDHLGADFDSSTFSRFYRSFLSAWCAVDGGFSACHDFLSIDCPSGLTIISGSCYFHEVGLHLPIV